MSRKLLIANQNYWRQMCECLKHVDIETFKLLMKMKIYLQPFKRQNRTIEFCETLCGCPISETYISAAYLFEGLCWYITCMYFNRHLLYSITSGRGKWQIRDTRIQRCQDSNRRSIESDRIDSGHDCFLDPFKFTDHHCLSFEESVKICELFLSWTYVVYILDLPVKF